MEQNQNEEFLVYEFDQINVNADQQEVDLDDQSVVLSTYEFPSFYDMAVDAISKDFNSTHLIMEELDGVNVIYDIFDSEALEKWLDIDTYFELKPFPIERFELFNRLLLHQFQTLAYNRPRASWSTLRNQATQSVIEGFEDEFSDLPIQGMHNESWECLAPELRICFMFRSFKIKPSILLQVSRILAGSLMFPGLNLIGKKSLLDMFNNYNVIEYLDHYFPTSKYDSDEYLKFIRFDLVPDEWKLIVVKHEFENSFRFLNVHGKTEEKPYHKAMRGPPPDQWYTLLRRKFIFRSLKYTKRLIRNLLDY
ncbi:hypothetical protein FDV_s7gp2 [Fiji disease virus]|uniref:Uncharacterized protein VP7-2 n=1 Tax=Fiji disease virus (isolate Sugarcane) TaxID=648172 RepID=VP72_FDVS|nr:hypothetical protein FDV_s7gp2 [Fiji disease virus]Q4VPH7.1 RecName: Full=Uncharacterized protein VP7-2 [Fiji disease virus isolate Sugarcane]AAX18652.1 unknown [Fiji disease virus]